MQVRTVQFSGPREVRVVEREVADPADEDVVVRTLYSGISAGTELLAFRGEIDPDLPLDERIGALNGTFSYPFFYGYSCVGVVERSDSVAPGTTVFAFHPHQDRFSIAPADVINVSGIDPRIATMFPLVETAFQITLDAGDAFAEPVVVFGLGSIGLITALLLQRRGARVLGVDPSEARRTFAQQMDIESWAPEQIAGGLDDTGVGDVPLVIEASGNPEALGASLPLLAHEGTVLVASWYGVKPVTLPLGAEFHRRRLCIRSSQVSSIPARLAGRWTVELRRRHVLELLTTLPLKRFATHEFDFERAQEAFATLDRGDASVMHVALEHAAGD